jgi:hypothetical protein
VTNELCIGLVEVRPPPLAKKRETWTPRCSSRSCARKTCEASVSIAPGSYSAGLSRTHAIARDMAIAIHHTVRQAIQSPVPPSSVSDRCVIIDVVLSFMQHYLLIEAAVLRGSPHDILR